MNLKAVVKHCGAPDVRVFVQPEKKVIATTSKDVGELILPPATLNIVEYDPKIHKDAKGVICTLEGAPCDFFLMPCHKQEVPCSPVVPHAQACG